MGRKGFAKICPENSFFIMSKEKGKLGYFWKHAFEVAESGPNNGSVISIDSGLPVETSSGGNLTRLSFDANKYDGTLNWPNKGTCWLQRYAATSDEALHSYPATRFGRNPSPVSVHPTIGSDLTVGNFASAGLMARTCTKGDITGGSRPTMS